MVTQLHFPRLILLSDDWGCFNADMEVIKGLAYPKMKITPKKISEILKELYDKGLLFMWKSNHHIWGYWMKWEEHGFSSGSEYNNGGQRVKHRRKTPVPPEKQLKKYILEHLGTAGDNLEKSASYLNPNLEPKHEPDKNILYEKEFELLWESYPKEGRFDSKESLKKFKAICGQGKLKAFKQITNGYLQFLEHQRVNEKFPQKAKHLKTWLNNWEGEREQYEDFKYEPPL